MNRWELAWKRFEDTGSILDYLAYCRLYSQTGTEGELVHADIDRWDRSESKKSWK